MHLFFMQLFVLGTSQISPDPTRGTSFAAFSCGSLNRNVQRKKITMLNFEKELAKYQPSLEVDEAEEAIYNNDLTDISDIIDKVLKEKKGRQV